MITYSLGAMTVRAEGFVVPTQEAHTVAIADAFDRDGSLARDRFILRNKGYRRGCLIEAVFVLSEVGRSQFAHLWNGSKLA